MAQLLLGLITRTARALGAAVTVLLALTGHLLHAVVLVGGLGSMAAIFAPGLADRAGLLRAPDAPIDRRLAELRDRAAAGTLDEGAARGRTDGSPADPVPAADPDPSQPDPSHPDPSQPDPSHPDPSHPDRAERAPGDPLLAAAVIGSAAAAGVHAAVAPMHVTEYPLLSLGFLVVAVLQAAWSLAVLTHARPDRTDAGADAEAAARLAVTGLLLQGACVTAWAVSRTVGLPAFLHGAGAQPVGPWDLAAVAWQVVALTWCVAHLRGRDVTGGEGALRPSWSTRGARFFLGGSALVLVLLTLSGASA